MITNQLTALVLAACVATASSAQTYAVFGNRSCGTWLKEREDKSFGQTVMQNWLMGYLSGRSYHLRGDPLRGLEGESAYLFLDNHCRSKPLDSLADAADALVAEMSRRSRPTR